MVTGYRVLNILVKSMFSAKQMVGSERNIMEGMYKRYCLIAVFVPSGLIYTHMSIERGLNN